MDDAAAGQARWLCCSNGGGAQREGVCGEGLPTCGEDHCVSAQIPSPFLRCRTLIKDKSGASKLYILLKFRNIFVAKFTFLMCVKIDGFCWSNMLKKKTRRDNWVDTKGVLKLHLFLFFSRWEGKDDNEVGRCKETGVIHVRVDPKFFRPTEVVSKRCRCGCVVYDKCTRWNPKQWWKDLCGPQVEGWR